MRPRTSPPRTRTAPRRSSRRWPIAELSRGSDAAAIAAAEKALANSKAVKIRFLRRAILRRGRGDRRRPGRSLAGLAAELQAEPQAYAKILEGEIALKSGDPRAAIKLLSKRTVCSTPGSATSISAAPTWRPARSRRPIPSSTAASSAAARRCRCSSTRSRPTATCRPVYYYQGRVREGLKNAGFAESYRAYLAIRGQSRKIRCSRKSASASAASRHLSCTAVVIFGAEPSAR